MTDKEDIEAVNTDESSDESEDEEKQLELGEHYLSITKNITNDKDKKEIEEKAVSCLIKASKKGNTSATDLLKDCLTTKKGITKKTQDDMKWCIETSSFEKRVREASRSLFRQLGGSKDPMSLNDYVAAVKGQEFDDKTKRLLIAAGKQIGTQITEFQLSKVLSEQIQGTINLTTSEREAVSQEYKSADVITKVMKYPMATGKIMFEEGIEKVSKEGIKWVTSAIPTNQLYLLSAFFLYSFISASLLMMIVPLLMFYITLAFLCIATIQMMFKRQKLKSASRLAKLLRECSPVVDVEESLSRFTQNSLSPYWVFFGVLPFCVVSFALSNKAYILCSILFTLSSGFGVASFFALAENYYDPVRWLAVFMNFLAALPTLLHNFPTNIPILSKVVKVTTSSFVTLDTWTGLKINIGLPSFAYSFLAILFVIMSVKFSWRGSYSIFLPFLVTQVWLNFATTLYPYTSWFGLLLTSIGNLLLPALVPLSMVIGFVYGVVSIVNSFESGIFLKLFLTLAVGAVPLIISQTESLFGIIRNRMVKKLVMIIFSVLALVPISTINFSGTTNVCAKKFELTWDIYNNLCTSGGTNRIVQQIGCKHFIGQQIIWNGTFQNAEVTEVTNSVEPLLSGLPTFIVRKIRCAYGKPFGDCNLIQTSDLDRAVCNVSKFSGYDCHLHEYDSYSFRITMTMSDFIGNISLDAGNSFRETLSALRQGDSLEITATLGQGQGTLTPTLKLRHIRCIKCEKSVPKYVHVQEDEETEYILKSINEGISVVVNFFWYPLLEYSN